MDTGRPFIAGGVEPAIGANAGEEKLAPELGSPRLECGMELGNREEVGVGRD